MIAVLQGLDRRHSQRGERLPERARIAETAECDGTLRREMRRCVLIAGREIDPLIGDGGSAENGRAWIVLMQLPLDPRRDAGSFRAGDDEGISALERIERFAQTAQ